MEHCGHLQQGIWIFSGEETLSGYSVAGGYYDRVANAVNDLPGFDPLEYTTAVNTYMRRLSLLFLVVGNRRLPPPVECWCCCSSSSPFFSPRRLPRSFLLLEKSLGENPSKRHFDLYFTPSFVALLVGPSDDEMASRGQDPIVIVIDFHHAR